MQTPETVASGSPDSIHGRSEHGTVNINRIDISEKTMAVVAIGFGVGALMTSFFAMHEANVAEREARMLQYYVLEMDAKLIAAGVKKPDESVSKHLGENK